MILSKIKTINHKKDIAILDTSSISFMQKLNEKGIEADVILRDYDLILIPEWVLIEMNDAKGRSDYLKILKDLNYPIYCIA